MLILFWERGLASWKGLFSEIVDVVVGGGLDVGVMSASGTNEEKWINVGKGKEDKEKEKIEENEQSRFNISSTFCGRSKPLGYRPSLVILGWISAYVLRGVIMLFATCTMRFTLEIGVYR